MPLDFSKLTVDLPPELLDEIVGHLLPHGQESLRSCSLVAKSWVYSSGRLLFKTVEILEQNLGSWLENISPTNVEILGHVYSLSYGIVNTRLTPREVIDLARRMGALRDYLSSGFVWSSTPIPSLPQRIQIFSAFQRTLTSITLENCMVTTSAVVTLIDYFPNLIWIYLYNISHGTDGERIPPLSRLLLRGLSVIDFDTLYDLDLLDELSGLGLRFEEVAIGGRVHAATWPKFAKRVVGAFGASARRLTLLGSRNGIPNLPKSHS